MKIRHALATDAAALAALEKQQPRAAGWGEAGFSGELTQSAAKIWCAEENGMLRGFLALRFAAGSCEILNIAVCPQYAHQGIGWALVTQALTYLQKQGVQQVSLEAAESNQPACNLYAKAGFRILGRRKDFYGEGQDALIWGKEF